MASLSDALRNTFEQIGHLGGNAATGGQSMPPPVHAAPTFAQGGGGGHAGYHGGHRPGASQMTNTVFGNPYGDVHRLASRVPSASGGLNPGVPTPSEVALNKASSSRKKSIIIGLIVVGVLIVIIIIVFIVMHKKNKAKQKEEEERLKKLQEEAQSELLADQQAREAQIQAEEAARAEAREEAERRRQAQLRADAAVQRQQQAPPPARTQAEYDDALEASVASAISDQGCAPGSLSCPLPAQAPSPPAVSEEYQQVQQMKSYLNSAIDSVQAQIAARLEEESIAAHRAFSSATQHDETVLTNQGEPMHATAPREPMVASEAILERPAASHPTEEAPVGGPAAHSSGSAEKSDAF